MCGVEVHESKKSEEYKVNKRVQRVWSKFWRIVQASAYVPRRGLVQENKKESVNKSDKEPTLAVSVLLSFPPFIGSVVGLLGSSVVVCLERSLFGIDPTNCAASSHGSHDGDRGQ